MSNKSKHKNRYQQQQKPPMAPPQTPGAPSHATPAAAPTTAASTPAPGAPPSLSLHEQITKLPEGVLREELSRKESALLEQELALETQRQRLTSEQELLDKRHIQIEQMSKEADVQVQDARREKQRLLVWESGLKERELNAEAGFIAERRQSLDQLEKEAAALRQDLLAARERRLGEERENHARIAAARAEWTREQDVARQKLNAELKEQRDAFEAKLGADAQLECARAEAERLGLSEQQATLRAGEHKLEQDRRKLDWDREQLDEDREDLDRLVEQRAAAVIERLQHDIQGLEQRLTAARADRDGLDNRLQRREEADLRFGSRTPEQVLAELETLRGNRDELLATLATRPDEQATLRLQELESERQAWEGDRFRLTQENLDLRRDLARRDIAVTELESLRDHKSALEARVQLAHQQIAELRADINTRLDSAESRSPFPACFQMDQNPELQRRPALDDRKIDLSVLIQELRHRIASSTDRRLYYSERDLRCFLGGLAMSRLHLLQGVSGTGKTSLAIAFARAVGADYQLVEVQAGWRDRQDLIGHYNAFERRFHETEFLKALYRAQCPQHRERLFLVVLDEMNLSHPEQYAADLLSALEHPEVAKRRFQLVPASVEGAPALLVDGVALPVPDNVWFIGTANHDETTRDFADKTYDRAHVMELPRHRNPFPAEAQPPREPLAFEGLGKAFERAQRDAKADGQRAYRLIEEHLAEPLAQRFRIGWGNRLERQVGVFVPVVIAAGGSIGEATDHIVATKLLRKLRDRHDTRMEDVRELRNLLTKVWPTLTGNKKDVPERSLEILEAETRRLGEDEQAEG